MLETPTKSRKLCLLCGYLVDDAVSACPNDGTTLKTLDDDALVGTTLSGRYRIESLIGTGGMGTVYLAHHILLNHPVALKVLRMQFGDNEPERIRRFNQEGRVISALHHPNVIGASDFIVDKGRLFLVMEYVKGGSLLDAIREKGRMDWKAAMSIFIQTCDAIAYAHGQGIIHRDIKPSNVMLTQDEDGRLQVKLLDFGVAKIIGGNTTVAPVTKTGIVLGSPPYMSPEQCVGHAPDTRSDIYSFGCVMYEVLTGRTPITGENSLEILHKQVIASPMEFHEFSPAVKVPPGLEKIVFKALKKEIDLRYQSMEEVGHDLRRLQADSTYIPDAPGIVPATAPDTPSARSNRYLIVAAMITVLVLFNVWSRRSPIHPEPSTQAVFQRPPHSHVDDEKAMAQAVVTLTRMLASEGRGEEAEEQLKKLIERDQNILPANDPAMIDMMRIETALEKKNHSK